MLHCPERCAEPEMGVFKQIWVLQALGFTKTHPVPPLLNVKRSKHRPGLNLQTANSPNFCFPLVLGRELTGFASVTR